MLNLLGSKLGRLRLLSWLEGLSLVLLVFIAVPLKYWSNNPHWVEVIGPIHGVLFLLFIVATLSLAYDRNWSFSGLTWKVLAASFIPFATFYVDRRLLQPMDHKD
ncbi:MAG: DUF3817 domain-containing protein [Bacteroidota bacterium]